MSDAVKSPDMTNSNWVWGQLSECVDALSSAWQAATEPPPLAQYVGDRPQPLRRMILVELIKLDLEQRWQGGRWPKPLEDYLAEFPELAEGGVPCDLIYEEYHVRKQLGDTVQPQQYFERFPQQASELGRLLGLEAPHLTTTLVTGDRVQQVKVGDAIDDFDLLTELGKGAFASVYLARQRSMQRLVALKISADKGNEPQTLAQLEHPYIVRVYDQRRVPERKLRLLYMQVITGGTLESVKNHASRLPASSLSGKTYLASIDQALERRGESPPSSSSVRHKLQHATWPQVVCWVGGRLASALAFAHGIGVLHRDIKPANVLVAADGSPKLADFNISFSSKVVGATPAAYFGGSLAYMSPEQLEAYDPTHPRQPEELDGRSDIYSLAVMLWELLTGSRPFNDEMHPGNWSTQLAVMMQTRRAGVSEQVRAKLPADCPPGLEQALLRCLSPNPQDRYATAAELARQLDLCLQPRAQRLLQAPKSFWGGLMRRYPVVALILLGMLPNMVMSGLNIAFNYNSTIVPLQDIDPHIRDRFFQSMQVVNVVAFPLAVCCVLGTFATIFRAVHRLARGEPINCEYVWRLRARCLRMGDYTALVSSTLWIVSGFVFSTWLDLPAEYYAYFVASQFLCGLIAATLTFFFITFVAVRVYYPWLVRCELPQVEEASQISALGKRIWIYYGGAVAVPLLSIFPIVLLDYQRFSIVGLAGLGLTTFALAFWLDREIRNDLAALALIVNPTGQSLGADTESAWAA